MPKNKRKSMASSDYFLESGQDKRSGDTSDVVKTIENVEKPRKRDLIAARLKEVILKPNPIVMKRREELRRKRVKRSQTGNSYSDDSHNRNSNRRNIHPQHHRNLSSWNDSDQSSDVSSHSSYYESSLDGDEAGWEENRKALHDKKEKKRSLRNLPKIYIVQQRYGVFATTFGIAQILILTVMVVYCGLAPILNPMINPMVGPYPDVLSYWGAKNTYLIINKGEWWRLLTPILLHVGVLHIFVNVTIQMLRGVLFEREWGSLHWVIIYLVSGAEGNLLSAIYFPNTLSVGSSGAMCGLFGAKLAEIVCRTFEKTNTGQKKLAYRIRKDQCKEAIFLILAVAAFCLSPMIDWASHLGGLVGGVFIGFALFGPSCYYCAFAIIFTLGGWAVTTFFFSFGIKYLSTQVEADEDLGDFCTYFTEYITEYRDIDDYQCVCKTWGSVFGVSDNDY